MAAGSTRSVGVEFSPTGDFGSFTESLSVGRSPPSGDASFTATGVSIPPAHLTVTKKLLPPSTVGLYDFGIDTSPPTTVTNIGNNGSTGSIGLNPGVYHVTETFSS